MIALRIVLWLIVLAILSIPAVAWFALEDTPLVRGSPVPKAGDLAAARDFLGRYDPRALADGEIATITATQREINAALATVLSTAPSLRARVVASRYGLLVAVTGDVGFPGNPFGRYMNIRTLVESSGDGLRIGRLSAGAIEVPRVLIRPVFILALDQVAGPGRGAAALETIRSVEVDGETVTVVYRQDASLAARLTGTAQAAAGASDGRAVRAYWDRLHETYGALPPGRPVSLTEFLRPVFGLAQARTTAGDPVAENRAALLALALYFGDVRLERFVGDFGAEAPLTPPAKLRHVRLQGRHDWAQHYLVSAGLAVVGGREVADFVGESKEVDDTGARSGFSFADIAAGRAGVRLAEVATASPASARQVQETLARTAAEPEFFPEVRDFPEGLDETRFRSRYGDRTAPAYRRLIAEMDSRIARIPLYR